MDQSRHAYIVDVQMDFCHLFRRGYLTDLHTRLMLGHYSRIVVIWQEHATGAIMVPRFLRQVADVVLAKDFDEAPYLAELNAAPALFAPAVAGRVWRNRAGEMIVRTGNQHETFLVRRSLEAEIRRTVAKGAHIDLIGGQRHQCLRDVEVAMQLSGARPTVLPDLCYGARRPRGGADTPSAWEMHYLGCRAQAG